MHQVHLSDKVYGDAKLAAAAGGFQSVDEFVDAVVRQRLGEASGDFDHRFTSEVIEILREAEAEARTGNNSTPEQMKAHLRAKKQ